jgi:diguanylate cyclase (GGDEF)-like protein/PAS domain S-box-containing protein
MDTNPPRALSSFMDLLLDAVCVVDKEGRFVFVSAAFERLFGYAPDEMIGKPMIDLVFPADRDRTLQAARAIMADQPQFNFENRWVRKDGRVVDILWSARWSASDELRIAVARDVTERKRTEKMRAALYDISEAAHAADDLQALFKHIHEIIDTLLSVMHFSIALREGGDGEVRFAYHADADGKGIAPDPRRFVARTLCTEVIRSGDTLLLNADTHATLPASLRGIAGDHARSWLGVPLKSGADTIGALVVQGHLESKPYTEDDRDLLQFVSTQVAAAIERKQMIARLKHIALYDHLTRLPNRELFHDRMRLALARAQREQRQLALLYIDLDHFKRVNDTLGHDAGDRLLELVAERLEQCVRASDTVARFGGDEFVMLLENIDSSHNATAVAEKICNALHEPFRLFDQDARIVPSVGIALFPQHGDDEKQLLRRADEAMYTAKKRGGNRFELWSRSTSAAIEAS